MYDFFVPTVNFFGPGVIKVTGERCKLLGGKKVLIVCDKILKSIPGGPVEQAVGYIEEAGIEVVYYDGVEPNPKDRNVKEASKIFKEEGCDMIVTIGGGSSHDCGKGIGIAVTHGEDLYKYAGIELLTKPLPPIICINTTAGTGSEVTRHCVITKTDTKPAVKYVIVSWRNTPLVSINDPELMLKKPRGLTAATGMDALTHAVECYVTLNANPVTDAVCAESIKLIAKYLRKAVAYGDNLEARSNMAYASLLAGMGFNNAGLGYAHAMAHQLGGVYDMPHGVANAILLPHVERYNIISNVEKFGEIAVMMGENIDGLSPRAAADKAIDAIVQLSQDVGIPSGLAEMGVKEEDFEFMSKMALKDGNAGTNPIKGNEKDIYKLFQAAM